MQISGAADAGTDSGIDAVADAQAATTTDSTGTDSAGTDPTATDSADTGSDADLDGPSDSTPGCQSAADCMPGKPYCDHVSGSCAACAYGLQCGAGGRCVDNACVAAVPCQSDKICLPAGGVCDKVVGDCVDCLGDGDCAVGKVCRAHQCRAKPKSCKGSKDCASAGQVCDVTAGECVDCVGGADCTSKEYCNSSLCLPQVCLPGAVTCASAEALSTCNTAGSGYDIGKCGTGQVCEGGACTAVICVTGTQVCDGAAIRLCGASGTAWSVVQTCGNTQTCKDAACQEHVCLPASVTCDGDVLETCQADGLGATATACPTATACADGVCKPMICQPNAAVCEGAKVVSCDAKGVTATVAADCATSAKLCKAGACVDKVCNAGALSCDGAATLLTCQADSLGWLKAPCPVQTVCDAGACKPVICTANTKTCDGKKAMLCDAKGLTFTTAQDCAASSKVCIDGACQAQLCGPGVVTCAGNSQHACNPDGMAYTDTPCAAATACDGGACKPVVCVAGSKTCEGAKVLECDAKGLAIGVAADCAASNQFCVAGVCNKMLCAPNSVACVGNALGICAGDGSAYKLMPCDDKNPCTADVCDAKTLACLPGAAKNCDDGNTCTIDECNTWTGGCDHTAVPGGCDDGTACTQADTCVGGKCIASPWGTVSTLAGSGVAGWQDGPAASAMFNNPFGVAWMPDGSVVVADSYGQRIRRISAAGTVTTLAGDGKVGFQDGLGANAHFSIPMGVAADPAGNVFVADSNNMRIRKIAPDGTVSTVAGTGAPGALDGPSASATFLYPVAVRVGPGGVLYVVDQGNHRIRKVAGGVVSTVAGSIAGIQDGPALQAQFSNPTGIALDPAGNLFIGDYGNNRVRRITPAGTVSTLAGNGQAGALDGPGASATFAGPAGVAWSPAGYLVVADRNSQRIRVVMADGTVATAAGTSFGWLDGPGQQAKLSAPYGVDVDPSTGVIFATDMGNQRIRKITPSLMFCLDGNPCTADGCDAKTGKCAYAPISVGQPCDDGTACTSGETCTPGGKCSPGKVVQCDDGNACTDDSCDPYTGNCLFANNMASCSTGDACDLSTVCQVGKCGVSPLQVGTFAGSAQSGLQNGPAKSALFGTVVGVARGPKGEFYVTDAGNNCVRRIAADGTVTTFAGNGVAASIDGPAADASFLSPNGIAVDKGGNVLVADATGHRIRRISAAGMVSTYAGTGTAGYLDGAAASAQFNGPSGLVLDVFGNLYVTEYVGNRVRKVSPQGVVTTIAGSGQAGYIDGVAASAQFNAPRQIVQDAGGTLYLADQNNNRIRKISAQGTVSTVAGSGQAGFVDGAASSAQFYSPFGLAFDMGGNLLVGDIYNHRIRRITGDGTVGTLAGSGGTGLVDGAATSAQFQAIRGLLVTPAGDTFIVDNYEIRVIASQTKLCDDGSPCTTDSCDPKTGGCVFAASPAKTPCSDGDACTSGDACAVAGACVGVAKSCDDGSSCTADTCNPYTAGCENTASAGPCSDGSVCTLSDWCVGGKCSTSAPIVSTLAGAKASGFLDGKALDSLWYGPHGVAVDAAGAIYAVDQSNVRIRKIQPDGTVTTLAGSGQSGYLDGAGASAQFNSPADLAVDKFGTVYVADAFNHRIRKISPTGVVTTLAGSGQAGYLDGPGTSAQFNTPIGVAIDGNGKLYVADMGTRRIRTVATDGTVGTLAGSGQQGNTNGPGTSASFNTPVGIAIDGTGNLFITDTGNHDVRRITALGVVSLVAGAGLGFQDGDGGTAKFSSPSDVAVAADGSLFIADAGNRRVRRITQTGLVSTWAGDGTQGVKDGPAAVARFNAPQGIAAAADGSLYVTDNNAIRRVSSLGVSCDDGQPCTADACDPTTAACSHVAIPDGGTCTTATPCIAAETCSAGKCGSGTADACDDKNDCTIDSCDPKVGCKHAQSGAPGCCLPTYWQANFDSGDAAGIKLDAPINKVGWQVWSGAYVSHSPTGVLYYGNKGNFDNGSANAGAATLPAVKVPSAAPALAFWLWMDTESGTYDDLSVQVQAAGASNWTTVWQKSASLSVLQQWVLVSANLAPWANQTVQVRFFFTTLDGVGNGGKGVFVDDIQFTQKCP